MNQENKKRLTHEDRVLKHLNIFGSITTFEAFRTFGITRLSACIFNLKSKGYLFEDEWITKKNRYGDIISFKNYKLVGKKED